MSFVRYFKPENRLAKTIVAPGGKLVEAAVADADVELLVLSDGCLRDVDEALGRIYRLCEPAPQEADLAEIYHAARDIAGLAGICGLQDLGAASLSFCKFLDLPRSGVSVNREAVKVHLNVMRILRHPEAIAEEDRRRILKDLEAMVGRLAKTNR